MFWGLVVVSILLHGFRFAQFLRDEQQGVATDAPPAESVPAFAFVTGSPRVRDRLLGLERFEDLDAEVLDTPPPAGSEHRAVVTFDGDDVVGLETTVELRAADISEDAMRAWVGGVVLDLRAEAAGTCAVDPLLPTCWVPPRDIASAPGFGVRDGLARAGPLVLALLLPWIGGWTTTAARKVSDQRDNSVLVVLRVGAPEIGILSGAIGSALLTGFLLGFALVAPVVVFTVAALVAVGIVAGLEGTFVVFVVAGWVTLAHALMLGAFGLARGSLDGALRRSGAWTAARLLGLVGPGLFAAGLGIAFWLPLGSAFGRAAPLALVPGVGGVVAARAVAVDQGVGWAAAGAVLALLLVLPLVRVAARAMVRDDVDLGSILRRARSRSR